MDKVSYALGLGIGRQLSQMGANEIVVDDFAQAIKDVIANSELKLSDSEAQTIVNQFFEEKQEVQSKAARAEGENFLAENAKKEGVVVLDRKSTRLNSSHANISYAVFCLKKKILHSV